MGLDEVTTADVTMPAEFEPRRLTKRTLQVVAVLAVVGLVLLFAPGLGELRDRHHHRLLLRQRQSHHPGLTGRPEPDPQARPTRAFLRESTTPATRAL